MRTSIIMYINYKISRYNVIKYVVRAPICIKKKLKPPYAHLQAKKKKKILPNVIFFRYMKFSTVFRRAPLMDYACTPAAVHNDFIVTLILISVRVSVRACTR